MRALPLLLTLACSEYDLAAPEPYNRPGAEEDSGGIGHPSDDTAGPPFDEQDDTGDDPDDGPPDDTLDDCLPGTTATWNDGEIYVLSWDRETQTGTLVAEDSGWYHVYDWSIAESGADQYNESAYIRISNTTFSGGEPKYSNCNDDWVVPDNDNDEPLPEGSRIYVGTFWLLEGDNTLSLNHFCPVVRDGDCTEFHITDDPDSTCDSSNANSVHFDGSGICLVPAF